MLEIKVPSPGESITEVQLANWLVKDGDYVEKDTEVAEIDSDKATLSIAAEEAGKIKLLVEEGETVEVGTTICTIDTDAKPEAGAAKPEEKGKEEKKAEKPEETRPEAEAKSATEKAPEPKQEKAPEPEKKTQKPAEQPKEATESTGIHISPLAKRLLEANNLSEQDLVDFYKRLRISKDDVVQFMEDREKIPAQPAGETGQTDWGGTRDTERKKMTTLRLKLSERLVAVKNETAMLTTFNEVNMTPIMEIRNKYKEAFKEKYGVSLGFMSFFTKAITNALQHFPQVNAQIDGSEMIYHNYADIGIAVSAPKGLMVPVIRNAEKLGMHEIEAQIRELATKARNGKLTIDEMTGGTFTITNGGVFGSMLSTPIINPPQSAILGMHNIVDRPVAVSGKVEIHPIMYVALSYDHRVIDGKESVSFLVKVKEMLEDPAKILFGGNDPVKALLGV
ncbi:MAG: 2-oxoglutarate dehydrogenase complex dihydrolipoyllysine-residue succinyltransferase, partial [Bacteroidales bacterium]